MVTSTTKVKLKDVLLTSDPHEFELFSSFFETCTNKVTKKTLHKNFCMFLKATVYKYSVYHHLYQKH